MEEERKNPFMGMKEESQEKDLPDEVKERIQKHSERTGEDFDTVKSFYLNHIKEHFNCDNWENEDEDLLIDWTESAFVQTRRGGTSGGGSTYVGEFLGVADRSDNRGTGLINWLIRTFRESPNDFFATGNGHYKKVDGNWVIKTQETEIPTGVSVEQEPPYGIHVGGSDYIVFVSRAGNPYSRDEMGRYSWFLGNEKEKFLEGNISLWRVDLKGEDTQRAIRIGEPCVIQVTPPREDDEYRKDVLDTKEGFVDNINYTDNFLSDDEKHLLKPSNFWVNNSYHELFVPLEDLWEAYSANATEWSSSDGRSGLSGPLVTTKGRITRMSHEHRDSDYDEDGRSYSFQISSQALESTQGVGRGSEVYCNVGSAVHDLTNIFCYRDDDGELVEYAEGTVLYIYGRIGMMRNNGEEYPKLTVFGVYANPRLSRKRMSGGNTDPSQFK